MLLGPLPVEAGINVHVKLIVAPDTAVPEPAPVTTLMFAVHVKLLVPTFVIAMEKRIATNGAGLGLEGGLGDGEGLGTTGLGEGLGVDRP